MSPNLALLIFSLNTETLTKSGAMLVGPVNFKILATPLVTHIMM